LHVSCGEIPREAKIQRYRERERERERRGREGSGKERGVELFRNFAVFHSSILDWRLCDGMK
jgi:hypothetical protein